MKNFIRELMLVVFLGTFTLMSLNAQTLITVGNGTNTYNYAPAYAFYNYGFSRMLYRSSNLQTLSNGGRITQIGFYVTNGQSGKTFMNQVVYMRGTTVTTESSGYIDPTIASNGCTQVWTGNLSVSSTGWVTITLSTPFKLFPGQNLEIFWNNMNGVYFNSTNWQSTTQSYTAVSRGYSDNSFSDATISNFGTSSSLPNIQITYLPLSRSAAVAAITSPSTNRFAWVANVPAAASIVNKGSDTINSCRVNWKVNNVLQTPVIYTNPLIEDSTPISVNLGTFTPDSNTVNNLTVWIDNALPYDSIQSDDTLSFDLYACSYFLNGNYTIGGAGADYATFADALNHLMICGVSGPTTFYINSGTYMESINLMGAIPGSSTTNKVLFTSAAGNADSVQIYVPGTTLKLSNVSNVSFTYLTLGSSDSLAGEKAVVFEGSCSNIDFYECNLLSYSLATSNIYACVYYKNSDGSMDYLRNVNFIKNHMNGGYYNMYLYYPAGNSTNMQTTGMAVTIDSNIMTNSYYYGLYSYYYASYPSVSYNKVSSRDSGSTNSTWYGLYFYQYQNVNAVVGNKIRSTNSNINSPNGIRTYFYFNSTSYNGNDSGLIANNEIILNSKSNGNYGMSVYYPYSNVNVLHNSVYVYGTNGAYAFHTYNSTTSKRAVIKNNNFVINAGSSAYPIYYDQYYNSSYYDVDYNNYYSSGSYVGYAGSAQSSMQELRAATEQDLHSISKSPYYDDYPNSIKVYGFDLACPLNNLVSTDVDNVTRTLPTMMGAYQFVPYVDYDITPFSLESPSLVVTIGVKEAVNIRLMNYSTNTLTSATINWSFNGVSQTAVNWTGNLASGSSVVVAFDSITPVAGINTLMFITSLPNNHTDTMTFNDTLLINLYTCDSLLNGDYIVGSGGDFASLNDAFEKLTNCGVNGPVALKLMTGNYDPLKLIGIIPGSNQINTITITSVSGIADSVVIGGNSTISNTTALALNGVANLSFKDVTIGMNSTFIGNAVEFQGMCEDVLFERCNILTYSNQTSSNYNAVRYNSFSGSSNTLKNIRFIDNTIDGGYANFYFNYPAGGSSNMSSSGMSVTIENNIMSNSYQYGIYSNEYARYEKISNNTITSRASGTVTTNWYGIYLSWHQNVENIVGNKISSTNTGISRPRGIYIYYYFNSTSYSGSGKGLVANNEIILLGSNTSATYDYFCGLYIYYPYASVNAYHNSIYLYRESSSTTYGAAIYAHNTSTSYQVNIKNNNLVTSLTLGGTSSNLYPLYMSSSSYANSGYGLRDFNNYFNANSTTIAYTGSARTITTLRSAHSQDMNSTNTDPVFASLPNDLTPSSWFSCPRLPEVPYDINGMHRTYTKNYMGCYMTTYLVDAGLKEFINPTEKTETGVSQPVIVRLVNYGKSNLTGVTIGWTVNGINQTPLVLTGLDIPQFKDTIIIVGNFVPVANVYNSVKTYCYSPNGMLDSNILNDTIEIQSFGCSGLLNGTYDVAGGNNDFASIDDVMAILNGCGVSGPVTIRLANGTYNTLSSIVGTFDGASPTNTITFTSLSGNADSVVIGAATQTALTLSGAQNLRFTNLTIGNNRTTNGVEFFYTNKNIEFYQCNILSNPTATLSSYACISYNSSSGSAELLQDIQIIKNNLNGGYYNIYMNYPGGGDANIGSSGMSVTIDSNLMTNSYYYGLYSYYYARYLSVSNNIVISRNSGPTNSTWYGLYFYYYQNVDFVVGNRIQSTNTSITSPYGIRIYYYFNSPSHNGSNAGLVANNEIILYTTSSYYGMYIYNPYSNVNILHNSVYMYGTGNAYGLYTYNSSSTYQPVIKNNNFVTEAGMSAYPIYYNDIYYTSQYFNVDYNNYYSSGSYVGYAGSAHSTLANLQNATGQDINSLNIEPSFKDTNIIRQNLHINGFDMLVSANTNVPTDIDGKSRIILTNIGCYHDFEPVNVDASMLAIVSPSDTLNLTTGQITPMTVKIANIGIDTIESVNIHWIVNGIENVYNWHGSLPFGEASSDIILGNFTPISGFNTFTVFTTQPNGVQDLNTKNDTLKIEVFGCDSLLNGTYVVGPNGDFANEQIAFDMLFNCGISGPVEFNFEAGTYGSMNFNRKIIGSSAINTITFTSLSGNADSVVIGAPSQTALTLDGVENLRFTNLTIGNSGTTYGVEFFNSNKNIEFYQCNILSNPTTNSNSYACISFNSWSGSSNLLQDIRIIKNHLDGGYYNIYMYYPGGGDANIGSSGMSVTIDSNLMTNSYYYGLYSYYYARYLSVSNNTVTSRNSGSISSTWYGLYFYYYQNVDAVAGNRIQSTNPSISYPYGIRIYYYFNSPSHNGSNAGLIANNEIILYTTSSYYGMNIYNPYSNVNILHNSVYMYGPGDAYGLYIYNSSTSYQPVIKNNNFVTEAGISAYPIYYNGTYYTSQYFNVDYNNYYSSGSYVGYAGGAHSTLANLQNATGQDINSLNIEPSFTDSNIIPQNLHINGYDMLVSANTNVPVDIDNVSRTAKMNITNMGCYHDFEPINVDASMLAIVNPSTALTTGQLTPISVKIGNMGIDTIDSVNIHWIVNGIENVYNWYGTLPFGNTSSEIILGNFTPISGFNAITVFTTQPNGVPDLNTKNDTLKIEVFGCDSLLNGIYVVGPNGDFANEEITMATLLNCGINGPVEFNFEAGTYGSINIDREIIGSSAINTVTFTSLSGNPSSVNFASTGNVSLSINGASNLIFKNITLNAILGTHGVEFRNTCNNILIYGCNILADPNTTQNYAGIYRKGSSGSPATLNDIRIIKNNINGGYYNIYWNYGGGSSSYMGNNCVIDSNVCTNAYYYGIYLEYSYTNFNSLSYNKITCRTVNQNNYFYGIRIYYYNNVNKVLGNKIHILNSAVNYAYPMYIYYYNNYTNNPYGDMLVANNEIITKAGNYSYGLYVYSYSNCEVINNSIYSSSGTTAYGLYLYTSNTSYKIHALNNNVYTENASTCYPLYIESSTYGTPSYVTLDYNNYGTSGNYVGYVGSDLSTLAQLRSATQQDSNSVSSRPSFLNSSTSLELFDYSGMICNRHDSVNFDINGESRTLLTPMGAYTVSIYEGYDLSINAIVEPINTSDVFCYQDFASIRMEVQNKGSYNIDFSAQPLMLHVEVNGAVTFQADSLLVIGSLSPTQKSIITITNLLPVSNNGIYDIKAWLSLPVDTMFIDDTIQSTYVIDKIILPYSVNFSTLPNGLVFKQIVGESGWTVESGAGTNPTISPSHGTGRLQFASATGRGSLASVTLQPINLRGTSSPKIEFWYAHDAAPGRDYTDVKISIDGGYTYTNILNVKRSNPAYKTPTFVKYEIDLTAYMNYACVIIGFEAGSFGGGNQNIDSICVSSQEDLLVSIDLMEQSEFVACELSNKELAVTLTNMTSQDFNFTTKPTQLEISVSGPITKNYVYPLTSGMIMGDTLQRFVIDTNFDFSINGVYTIKANLKSVDDNTINDTATVTRTIDVDLELKQILPIPGKKIGDRVYPVVVVKNNSNMPVRDIPLRLRINHGSDITETISGQFEPGDSITYNFVNYYTVPVVDESQPYYLLEIKTELACDGKSGNNSKTGYYNIVFDEFVDLSIISVDKPNPQICDTGLTKVYPVIQIKNNGTGMAGNITLFVTLDSAGTILKSYSEAVSNIYASDSITHVCVTPYIVPNFDNTYKVTVLINVTGDVDESNNKVDVTACAIKKDVGISDQTDINWSMGQNIPNPASLSTKILYNIPQDGKVTFKLMSINGQLLYVEEFNSTAGSDYFELNTYGLSNGIYYYSMEYQGQRIVKKMTIQR